MHVSHLLRLACAAACSIGPWLHADYGIPEAPPPAAIRLNSVGFRCGSPKVATVLATAKRAELVRIGDQRVVWSGPASDLVQTAATDTGESLRIIDFSSWQKTGTYRLRVDGVGESAEFAIADDVYVGVYRAVLRGFYGWRCGVELLSGEYGWVGHRPACHLNDGKLDLVSEAKGIRLDGTGGWHDAGDYNKYVVNAAFSVGMLLRAWEDFADRIKPLESGRVDGPMSKPHRLLDEVKFELQWLLKMQTQDGGVYHKLSARDFSYWGTAEQDRSERFFSPVGSTATAAFAACMAQAARLYAECDPDLSKRCQSAARRAHDWLSKHPKRVEPDQAALKTGMYQCSDTSYRLWALQEWWETTGELAALQAFETQSAAVKCSWNGPSWGAVEDLALTGYIHGKRQSGKSQARLSALRDELQNRATEIAKTASQNAHGRGLGAEPQRFFWGCNGNVASQTLLLYSAAKLRPAAEFHEAAERCIGHLLGRNYHGRSYLTGVGHHPPCQTHDRRGAPQLPGYLVGGPWPTAKEYLDVLADASRNEIAINWNASLLYALAGLLPAK